MWNITKNNFYTWKKEKKWIHFIILNSAFNTHLYFIQIQYENTIKNKTFLIKIRKIIIIIILIIKKKEKTKKNNINNKIEIQSYNS